MYLICLDPNEYTNNENTILVAANEPLMVKYSDVLMQREPNKTIVVFKPIKRIIPVVTITAQRYNISDNGEVTPE